MVADASGVPLTSRRIAAYLIDVGLLAAVLLPIAVVIGSVLGGRGLSGVSVWLRSVLSVSIPAWSYFILAERAGGRTAGKRLMRLRTVTVPGGGRPATSQALLRTAVTLAPWELTHLAFFALAPRLGQVTTPQIVVASAAYIIMLAYVVITLRSGGRRSPADVLARTRVVAVASSAA